VSRDDTRAAEAIVAGIRVVASVRDAMVALGDERHREALEAPNRLDDDERIVGTALPHDDLSGVPVAAAVGSPGASRRRSRERHNLDATPQPRVNLRAAALDRCEVTLV
jgi:hypothetical protein